MYVLRPMNLRDLSSVMVVNARCFSSPWPAHIFEVELSTNSYSHWVVVEIESEQNGNGRFAGWLRRRPERRIVGFGGFWLINGEAHISNIGVDPDYQRRGLGELLLLTMVKRAMELNADWTSLEVRTSNRAAISLYEKYQFRVAACKKRYYRDDGEDAYWMIIKPLMGSYWTTLEEHTQQLAHRLEWHDRFLIAEER